MVGESEAIEFGVIFGFWVAGVDNGRWGLGWGFGLELFPKNIFHDLLFEEELLLLLLCLLSSLCLLVRQYPLP